MEEESETVFVLDANEQAKIMTQGQWMKGCPEGGEQSFLFGLYSELSEGACKCPHGCGRSVPRKKQDFFAIFVSCPLLNFWRTEVLKPGYHRPNLAHTFPISRR